LCLIRAENPLEAEQVSNDSLWWARVQTLAIRSVTPQATGSVSGCVHSKRLGDSEC
jgi:hypothetical protein